MRLPPLSDSAFLFWRAVELTGRQPRYLLSITGSADGEVDMLFSVDQEVLSFLDTMAPAKPRALHVLVPNGWAGSTEWQLLPVTRLDVLRVDDGDGNFIALLMGNGQTVRARDLAPVAQPPGSVLMSILFNLQGLLPGS